MLSGDIDTEGKIKINLSVILKLSISITISLYGGSAFIEYQELGDLHPMTHGFIMLILQFWNAPNRYLVSSNSFVER